MTTYTGDVIATREFMHVPVTLGARFCDFLDCLLRGLFVLSLPPVTYIKVLTGFALVPGQIVDGTGRGLATVAFDFIASCTDNLTSLATRIQTPLEIRDI